jgi:phosphate transport system substrate-binding protein
MGMPFVGPSVESATDGSYPLTRLLYLYVNMPPKQKRDPLIIEFLKFINSRQG